MSDTEFTPRRRQPLGLTRPFVSHSTNALQLCYYRSEFPLFFLFAFIHGYNNGYGGHVTQLVAVDVLFPPATVVLSIQQHLAGINATVTSHTPGTNKERLLINMQLRVRTNFVAIDLIESIYSLSEEAG